MQDRYEHIANLIDYQGQMVSLYECQFCYAIVNDTSSHISAVHPEPPEESEQ